VRGEVGRRRVQLWGLHWHLAAVVGNDVPAARAAAVAAVHEGEARRHVGRLAVGVRKHEGVVARRRGHVTVDGNRRLVRAGHER